MASVFIYCMTGERNIIGHPINNNNIPGLMISIEGLHIQYRDHIELHNYSILFSYRFLCGFAGADGGLFRTLKALQLHDKDSVAARRKPCMETCMYFKK